MSELTPQRAAKSLDRAVDLAQLVAVLAGLAGILFAGQAFTDEGDSTDLATGVALVLGAVLVYLVACWARAWALRPTDPT